MNGTYNSVLVALSVFVAIVVSYVALDSASRVTAARGRSRVGWLLGGSTAMGVGIWSMHFVAMLAFRLPVRVGYDVPLVLLSVLAAVAASAVALFAVSRERVGPLALCAAALSMGGAIAGMHYTGMAAMRVTAHLSYDPILVTLSVAIAIAASLAALWLAFRLRDDETSLGRWRKVGAAVVMGSAIAGMHYTAMAAAHFTSVPAMLRIAHDTGLMADQLAAAIIVASLLVLAMAIIGAMIDRQIRGQLAETDLLRRTEERVRQSEQQFRSLIENASDMIAILGADGTTRYHSPSSERILGYPPNALVGRSVFEHVHPDDRPGLADSFTLLLQPSITPISVEFRHRHKDGSWRHIAAVWKNLLDEPTVGGIVANSRDVTDQRRLEGELTHQAFHDTLTGLANSALFRDRVENALERARRTDENVSVFFLDLDDFKRINDSLGHVEGDRLLVGIAERLLCTTRGSDTVARLGGDEFAILLRGLDGDGEAITVAERIMAAMQAPIALEGKEVRVSASVGIAYRRGTESVVDLLRNADLAMYRAKNRGKGRYQVFERSMHTAVLDQLQLEADLRQALDGGELLLHYQPIVCLTSGGIIAVEALARWKHPKRGFISPAEFIPLAEETGLIDPLSRWVLTEACTQARLWHDMRVAEAPLAIAVNISGRQLHEATVMDDLAYALRESGMDPRNLVFEITESVIMQNIDTTLRQLRDLKALGVGLAIDDFGTGYSSLSYLQRFPVDILKIDKSFVDAVGRGDVALVRGITALAETLGLMTVAEGIEDASQVEALQMLGCHFGQGFYLATPLPAEECTAFLAGLKRPKRKPKDIAGRRGGEWKFSSV
jgi:diguanylate cyclase (GGDEF)-like protein/PAS domain S-box-containing protein